MEEKHFVNILCLRRLQNVSRRLYMEVVTVDCIKVGNNLGSILWSIIRRNIFRLLLYEQKCSDRMPQFQEHTYQGLETQSTLNLKNVANVNDTYIIKNQPFFNHRLHVLGKNDKYVTPLYCSSKCFIK